MTRLAFREPLSGARSRAALAMLALAGATLAITGQVEPLALLAPALAIGLVAAQGAQASAWRSQARVLNGGLVIAVLVGVLVYRRGALAVIAFADFALLAGALQLLDARPRRSEFLLVALAVFQVVLAANLTDSAFYPPLLAAFTAAVVWTLLVHTLRAEALEAGEPESARRALTTGLRRTTALASIGCVVLGVALFPLLPRIRSGGLLSGNLGSAGSVAGFSDQVELGAIGRIRLDSSVMLRVTPLDGPPRSAAQRYWRGLAFDHFDGRRWAVTPPGRSRVAGDPDLGANLGGPRRGVPRLERIVREPVDGGVIFTSAPGGALRGALGRIDADANGSLYAHASANRRVEYELASWEAPLPDRELAAHASRAPQGDVRALQLPELDPRVAELAHAITRDAHDDATRARELEHWLRENGHYTTSPPPHGARDGSPVEDFLLADMTGHCEYFASGMVVLARSLGLPARLVNGFAGGEENALGDFIEVRQSDAHSWVEVYFEGVGWVPYDPTPPDLRLADAAALRGDSSLAELASALELWWFRNVVDFDRNAQARALTRAWLAFSRLRDRGAEAGDAVASQPGAGIPAPLRGAALAAAVLLVAMVLADLRRRRRRRRSAGLPRFYADALGLLARRGLVRGPAVGARRFAAEAEAALPPAAAQAFRALTERYLRERFAGEPGGSAPPELRALRDGLRPSRGTT